MSLCEALSGLALPLKSTLTKSVMLSWLLIFCNALLSFVACSAGQNDSRFSQIHSIEGFF
jgi:hypothetical protein